jgi:hypothetical protein
MTHILQNFENEVTELFKAYRMAHFSLYNMEKTFYDFKEQHPQIEVLALKDKDFDNEIIFNEEEVNKNRENGTYQRIIAGSTIAMLYNIWEDKYRIEIANKMSLTKNEIRSDFFKELNYIRQSITHNSFNPSSKLEKLEKLSFIGNSTILKLSSWEVKQINELLLAEIYRLKKLYCS